MAKPPKVSSENHDKVCKLLKTVVEHFDKEDVAVRQRQIRLYKKLKYYWDGFQRLYWNEVAHDWRVYDREYDSEGGNDQGFYDKPVNVFRSYLEAIIAALSVAVPSINCYPDDADNISDIETAKAGDLIAELIYKDQDVILKWLHALFVFCTEGAVYAYNYPDTDEKYGTYDKQETEDVEQVTQKPFCPTCGNMLQSPDEDEEVTQEEKDEFQPDDDDVAAHDIILNKHQLMCPVCLAMVDPEYREHKFIVTRIVGKTTEPKTRQCIEIYGGLFVKTPTYAIRQNECPYLKFSYETHYANVVEKYPEFKDKFDPSNNKLGISAGGLYDPYERWGRLSTQYNGEYPLNTVTVGNTWLRPAAYHVIQDDDDCKLLRKHFPDGCKVVQCNDSVLDYENESLDDCWTITHNPLSDYLQHDPLGLLATSIQEITNDLVSLTLQTIEHGITQTFADPAALNFKAYRESEVAPGDIYPAKAPAGGNLSNAFYEVKTANLSPEVGPFAQRMYEMGQVVTGALPSLSGGAQQNSSKTAAQYAMSRAQALQRLNTTWKMLTIWWKQIFGKVIPQYIQTVVEDEKFVSKDEAGNFINVWIRKSELLGKIGKVELEASEELPITWSQKKDVIMQMMQAANPQVMEILSAPENLGFIQQALGIDELTIPGNDDREKQWEEIKLLLDSEPASDIDQMTGQPTEVPSVTVDPIIDNHQIHIEICTKWAKSTAGRLAKIENQNGYKNVLLHLEQHVKIQQPLQAMNQNNPMPVNKSVANNSNPQNPAGNNPAQPVAQKLPQGASNATIQ